MLSWIKENLFKKSNRELDIDKKIKNINTKIKNINGEIAAIAFVIQKQSELISALATVQAEILQALDYEQTLYSDSSDQQGFDKIVLVSSDDDDTFH
tara:strand:+ start:474 stop:764 length:291 start_codon:yes stop_codon:yes gene_type:complete